MAAKPRQSTYGELAQVIEDLNVIVRERRRQLGLSSRAAAAEMGLSYSLLAGIERGDTEPRSHTLIIILKWLEKM
jgi:ribosome-binding protein aMBF1 (putative translation factor)